MSPKPKAPAKPAKPEPAAEPVDEADEELEDEFDDEDTLELGDDDVESAAQDRDDTRGTMLEAVPEGIDELVEFDCANCDSDAHELIRAADAGWTIRCIECKTVRTIPAPKKDRFIPVNTILAKGGASQTVKLHVPLDRKVAENDEYELDGHRVRITALEKPDGTRPKSALGRDVKVLYAVLFDTVTLRYAVNQGETTRAFQEEVSPELEVHVGMVRHVQGFNLAIKTLKSDQNRTLHRGFLLARNVNRVFADMAKPEDRVGDKVWTRKRGVPKGHNKGAGNRDKKPRGAGPRRS